MKEGWKLFEPFTLAGMELKNRLVMGPMVVNYATNEGYVTGQTLDHYEAQAKGGPGLIITEAVSVDAGRSKCWHRQLCIDKKPWKRPIGLPYRSGKRV